MCIFKGLHERKIDFHLLAKLPKNKKVIQGLMKSKFRSNIYLNISSYGSLYFAVLEQ